MKNHDGHFLCRRDLAEKVTFQSKPGLRLKLIHSVNAHEAAE